MLVLAVLIAALVAGSFLTGDGDTGDTGNNNNVGDTPGDPPGATPTTSPEGLPPAADASVCRTLLTTEEAEALVGRDLEHPVIEPIERQCAWPLEEGTPLDAELFFVLKEQQATDLLDVLRGTWDTERFRFEAVDGLGDQAFFVIRRADSGAEDVEAGTEFVEGLDVYAAGRHVVLGNGGERPVWEGEPDEIRERLVETMRRVLDRIDETTGTSALGLRGPDARPVPVEAMRPADV